MAPDTSTPLWEVTGQRPTMGLNAAQMYVPGIQVDFRTRSGATGNIFVPQSDYSVDAVRAMIVQRAEAMETVHQLKG